ncbi:MAG: PIN domain-containing protein [Coriobacteriia bacterium]|nr:PIN domain-containing protein [Coriobacteriia bacterium]
MATDLRCLIDTNVLVYARSTASGPEEHAKCEQARSVVRACARAGIGVLSTQVLIETFDVFTRGTARPSERAAVLGHVAGLAAAFQVLATDAQTVLLAGDCSCRQGLRIFDALVWAAAYAHGIRVVLSEDFSHRSEIDGVSFIDPFAADFTFAELGLRAE